MLRRVQANSRQWASLQVQTPHGSRCAAYKYGARARSNTWSHSLLFRDFLKPQSPYWAHTDSHGDRDRRVSSELRAPRPRRRRKRFPVLIMFSSIFYIIEICPNFVSYRHPNPQITLILIRFRDLGSWHLYMRRSRDREFVERPDGEVLDSRSREEAQILAVEDFGGAFELRGAVGLDSAKQSVSWGRCRVRRNGYSRFAVEFEQWRDCRDNEGSSAAGDRSHSWWPWGHHLFIYWLVLSSLASWFFHFFVLHYICEIWIWGTVRTRGATVLIYWSQLWVLSTLDFF